MTCDSCGAATSVCCHPLGPSACIDPGRRRSPTIAQIQAAVTLHYRLRPGDLVSPRRNRHIAYPRHIAMLLARELTTASMPRIGRAFGDRDHTTVLHALKNATRLLSADSDYEADFKALHAALASQESTEVVAKAAPAV